jgi:hypothetical protein
VSSPVLSPVTVLFLHCFLLSWWFLLYQRSLRSLSLCFFCIVSFSVVPCVTAFHVSFLSVAVLWCVVLWCVVLVSSAGVAPLVIPVAVLLFDVPSQCGSSYSSPPPSCPSFSPTLWSPFLAAVFHFGLSAAYFPSSVTSFACLPS